MDSCGRAHTLHALDACAQALYDLGIAHAHPKVAGEYLAAGLYVEFTQVYAECLRNEICQFLKDSVAVYALDMHMC